MNGGPTGVLDLLLHPLRLRIIQLLFDGRRLTARQIAAAQPEIPQATLYRHLHQLVEGGVLVVVVRGRDGLVAGALATGPLVAGSVVAGTS